MQVGTQGQLSLLVEVGTQGQLSPLVEVGKQGLMVPTCRSGEAGAKLSLAHIGSHLERSRQEKYIFRMTKSSVQCLML